MTTEKYCLIVAPRTLQCTVQTWDWGRHSGKSCITHVRMDPPPYVPGLQKRICIWLSLYMLAGQKGNSATSAFISVSLCSDAQIKVFVTRKTRCRRVLFINCNKEDTLTLGDATLSPCIVCENDFVPTSGTTRNERRRERLRFFGA